MMCPGSQKCLLKYLGLKTMKAIQVVNQNMEDLSLSLKCMDSYHNMTNLWLKIWQLYINYKIHQLTWQSPVKKKKNHIAIYP